MIRAVGSIYLFILYLFINQTLLSATYTMTSGQLYIVHNCSNFNKISLSNAMICRIKQKSFQFLFKKLGVVISLMSTSRLFHALGAATENARSDETSLERGTTRSCLPAERREAHLGMLATGVTNSIRYDYYYTISVKAKIAYRLSSLIPHSSTPSDIFQCDRRKK